jgi:hypothetical protein
VTEETTSSSSSGSATIPEPDPRKHYFWGTGRRKRSVARVRIRAGEGKIEINKKPLEKYFAEDKDRIDVVAPLKATETFGKVDIFVNVKGGGTPVRRVPSFWGSPVPSRLPIRNTTTCFGRGAI